MRCYSCKSLLVPKALGTNKMSGYTVSNWLYMECTKPDCFVMLSTNLHKEYIGYAQKRILLSRPIEGSKQHIEYEELINLFVLDKL